MRAIYSESADFKIGHDNSLIFKSSDDMKHFREATEGSIVIMGRKTYESIGSPLKNRLNIVLTNSPEKYKDEPETGLLFRCFSDIPSFMLSTIRQIYVIGGVEIFRRFSCADFISSIYVTTFKQESIYANKVLDITKTIDDALVLRSEKKIYKDVRVLDIGYKLHRDSEPCDINVLIRELYVREQEKEEFLINTMEKLNILAEEHRERIRIFSYVNTKLKDILNDLVTFLNHMNPSFTSETLREIIYLLDTEFKDFSNSNFDETTVDNYCLTSKSVLNYIKRKYL